MKKLILLVTACLALAVTAQVDASKVNKVYESRIQMREVADPAWVVQNHKSDSPVVKTNQQVETGCFAGLLKVAKKAGVYGSESEKQQLDSIVRFMAKGPVGTPSSKQEFVYTNLGTPQHCFNYVQDSETGAWRFVGEYNYEYDEQGRLIEATSVSNDGYVYGEKYEYIYGENGKPYTERYYYSLGEDNEWIPVQRGEFEYDSMNHTTLEAYYYTEDGGDTWIGQEKKEATYDNLDRMTSYYPYDWDYENNDWKGSMYFEGQKFTYNANGQDDLIEGFAWENGQWVNYYQRVYSYDDNNQMISIAYNYWNREKQDWLGGDSWGAWGEVMNNSKTTYTYDAKGRCILEEAGTKPLDAEDYVLNFRRTRELTDLENGHLNNEEKVYYLNNAGEFYLYNHRTIETNTHGSEVHFLNRQYVGATLGVIARNEEVREIQEDDNRYLSGHFYAYTQDAANTRYGESYEYCLYDENGNLTHTHHMKGTSQDSDTSWSEYLDFAFGYEQDAEGNWVLIANDNTSYENEEWKPSSGYATKYDFTINRDNVTIWPISNKGGNFYVYKTLEEYSYQVYAWNNTLSEYTDEYYYSEITQSGIEDVKVANQTTSKTEYFDLQGRRVSADTRGLIIVREADGTVSKVLK